MKQSVSYKHTLPFKANTAKSDSKQRNTLKIGILRFRIDEFPGHIQFVHSP